MRTTVTLDEDVAQVLRQLMHERGVGFKALQNELLRRGLQASEATGAYTTPTFGMAARPQVDLDNALTLAAALDDEETLRKLELAK